MGTTYVQLSLDDRCQIARLHQEGRSIRQIAASLHRAPSTIARELKRNSGRKADYRPAYANEQTKARRWKGSKLERQPQLRNAVLQRLARGWSPEQVAGRMARDAGTSVVSYETIYRFIYAEITRTKDFSWRLYLPRSKSKRGYRGQRGGSPASFIEKRLSIDRRPLEALDRSTPGHWEADLMAFAKYGQAILTLHERQSRFMLASRPENKTAVLIAEYLETMLAPLPAELRRTLTFDNGTEFARHHWLHNLGLETFFCDPYSPWQKGGIENAIGRMRRLLPRKTDLATLPDKRFFTLVQAYNKTPRKCLDYRTPAETLLDQLLHFKCESTWPPARP
jgi:IS30 family transposase